MVDNSIADYLKQQKEDELRKFLIKDSSASTRYERQIVKEISDTGAESYREIDVPRAMPELLCTDLATTNFSRNDKTVKMAVYKISLAYASAASFMTQKGMNKGGKYNVNLSPYLSFLTTINSMLCLCEKSNDSEFVDKLLRQHIKQESREFIEQRQPQGGFLAPKQQV